MASNDTAVVTSPSSIPHHLSTRSPRSSLESSPRTPTSPFLQNLSNRFRKGSNASNFSSASEPPAQPANHPDSAEDAQSAKRFVLSIVRNDWEWPATQTYTVPNEKNVTQAEEKQQSILAQREAVSWRTRHEATSDLDLDLSPVTASGRRRNKRNSDPYRFENPDAIANVIQQKRIKRRRANVEEARWNEGLRTWTERRDAWTAAQPDRPKKRSSSDNENHHRTISPARAYHKASMSDDQDRMENPNAAVINGNHDENGRRTVLGHDVADTNDATEDDALNGPYLPIYPPLFSSSHTLRARIKPAAYPTIYSKVVLQSLTPNVPIPLGHMVSALVDGWKAEGNWPPQTLVEQQQHALLKRAKGAKKGETAFQKWRRERDAERNQNGNVLGDDFIADSAEDDDHGKKGFRKSISGAVRKVFGFNHEDVEEDGGLAKLGLSFGNSDGLMDESRQVAEDNVTLNKGLLENGKQ